MEEESSSDLPSFDISCLSRVEGPSLDPQRKWYVVSKEICGSRSGRLVDFATSISKLFPDEIRNVAAREIRPARSERITAYKNYTRRPTKLYVVSTFGLCVGLLRQRDVRPDSLLRSPFFQSIVQLVNSISLEPHEAKDADFGAKPPLAAQLSVELAEKNVFIQSLELQLQALRARIADLESELQNLLASSSPDSSCSSTPSPSPSPSEASLSSIEEIQNSPNLGSTTRKRKVLKKCREVKASLSDVCEKYGESISCVLGNAFIFGDDAERSEVTDTISDVVDMVMEAKGSKRGLSELLSSETFDRIVQSMRVPDWVLLYFKLQTKLPDSAWQTLLNLTKLGKSGRSDDSPLLLTKNEIKAVKKLVFSIVRRTLNISKVKDVDFEACDVDLQSVLVWAIREQRLYGCDSKDMEFNIKLDGRPLGGKDQVALGVAPIDFANKSSESALSIYPLAIANCKEKRANLKQLLRNLNSQKNDIKKHGIQVDGKMYNIKFTVTLDYKALLLLLNKKDDEDFVLGGKGYDVECCAFCDAIRACTSHGADADEACLNCLRSKANIGRCSGLRDDLNFLLEEDLSSINLCSLHCEMRNCEQLLGSLGLFAYQIGSLDLLNKALSDYGPENTRGFPRVTIKERKGQQTMIDKRNIHVASFSGCTEREILKNFEVIVQKSLPLETVAKHYREGSGCSEQVILNYVTYFEERITYINEMLEKGMFVRDFGIKQETVKLEDAEEFKTFLVSRKEYWLNKQKEVDEKFLELEEVQSTFQEPKKKKRKTRACEKEPPSSLREDSLAKLAAELQIEFFLKACCNWRDIALTMRDRVFKEDEEQSIDIHEIKCKEWGFMLKKLFGHHLGTGDYGHLVVDHSAMLLRHFRSMYKYSGQGFESSHKLHRQLYSKATNHDASGPGQSLNQILTHWYGTMLLSLQYAFHQAKDCIISGKKKFTYRGCGWKNVDITSWSKDTIKWIMKINDLFKQMFGGDFLCYTYSKDHGTSINEEVSSSILEYNHQHWEVEYAKSLTNDEEGEAHSTLQDETKNFCKPEAKVEIEAPTTKAAKPASKHARSCKVSDDSLSDESSVIGPVSPDVDDMKEHHSGLRISMANATTRAEVAALFSLLPPLSTLCTSTTALHPVFGLPLDNPFDLDVRPCETVVDRARTLLATEKRKGTNPSGVKITGMGQFSEEGLAFLKQFCAIADTNRKVSSEANWLAHLKCSSADVGWLQKALWHHSASTVILRHGNKSIDVTSFSDLVEERYIDSFVIDISIAKFIEEARASGKDDTLYFPSEVYEWLKSSKKEFKQAKLAKETSKMKSFYQLKRILLPVHMPNHWGLACVDLPSMKMYFDDGLRTTVPRSVLPAVKQLLDLLAEMHPSHPSLQTRFWQECNSFKRFGMPSQAPVDSKMIGTGSCGIGVILAAKDFLEKGSLCIKNFQWQFCNMDLHRKNLMLQILNWSV